MTRRRGTFLHLQAPAYSLWSQYKLTFGMELHQIQESSTGVNTNIQKTETNKQKSTFGQELKKNQLVKMKRYVTIQTI